MKNVASGTKQRDYANRKSHVRVLSLWLHVFIVANLLALARAMWEMAFRSAMFVTAIRMRELCVAVEPKSHRTLEIWH